MKKNTKLESLFSELFYEKAENVTGGEGMQHWKRLIDQAFKAKNPSGGGPVATADQSWGGPNGEANDCIAD